MTFDRSTKGTHRYAEEGEEEEMAFRTLYIRKSALDVGGPPQRIEVTVRVIK